MTTYKKNDDDAVGYKRPRNEAVALPDGKPRTKKKKGKNKSPEKRTHATPFKDFPSYHAEPASAPGRWRLFIGAGETAYIADNVMMDVVIKNDGPSTVLVYVSHDGRGEKLVANILRVIPIMGPLTIETMDDEYAILEMEFLSKSKF